MVVEVGLTLVEPVAAVEVNVPGVMAMLVAPVVAQLSVLLAPEVMPVGFAAKELTVGVGCELVPPDEDDDPQPMSPAQANRTTASSAPPRAYGFHPGNEKSLAALQLGKLIPPLYCQRRSDCSSRWL